MTAASLAALFATLALLAAVPSLSVLTVVSRSLAGGARDGVLATSGIVVGDVFYIVLALFGGSALLAAGGAGGDALRVVGAGLLGVFAWRQWNAAGRGAEIAPGASGASFVAGLAVTLADAKALLFYLVLLPAFVDVGSLGVGEVALVVMVAVLAVGSVKLAYALAAARVAAWIGAGRARLVERGAACALAVAAALLLVGAFVRS